MGWIERLCETYDVCISLAGKEKEGEPTLLPVAHSTANAQIEVYLDEQGNMIKEKSTIIEKNGWNEVTIIPVTEDSATRTNGNMPHPLHDKLCYVAGDFVSYTGDDKREAFYKAYIQALEKWVTSEYTCDYIRIVLEYLQKGCLICDLIDCGILHLDESGCLSDINKIHGIPQSDVFIRFGVVTSDGEILRAWKDKDMYHLYEQYYIPNVGYDDICFASGLMERCTLKHPNKLRNSGDKAKLISGNDSSGFTFRGRFRTKEEALSVGYVASQKVHNALRWLIQKQGYKRDGNTIVVWTIPNHLRDISHESFCVPDVFANTYQGFYDDLSADEDITGKEIAVDVIRAISGYKNHITDDSKVFMISIDAATQGRMAIEYYHEFSGNEFLENISDWHMRAAVPRVLKDYERDEYVYVSAAPSMREIALAAYGIDRGGYLDCDNVLIKNTVKRLFPCVTGLMPHIPKDILRAVVTNVENPLTFKPFVWEHQVYAVACALLHKEGCFEKEYYMENRKKERAVIWGELLALLDEIERRAMYVSGKSDTENRLTNAKKAWNKYVRKPLSTYERVYQMMIQGYMRHLSVNSRDYFENEITKCINKLQELDGCNNDPLSEEYLVGYYLRKKVFRESIKN